MIVDRDNVLRILRGLDGPRSLKNLFVRELGYDSEGGAISTDDWPEEVAGALAEDPSLLASSASEGRFTVIHTRISTPGRLSLITERKILERLRQRYPFSLYVFSDAEDTLWHFVNAPHGAGGAEATSDTGPARKQYRRIVIGPDEQLRTATERLSMLSVDDLAERSGKEGDELSPLEVQAAHDKAFDVESVTRGFFEKYRDVFVRVEGLIEGIPDPERKRLFTQRLFNRLMFLAFVQKKGWLRFGGDPDYLPALWRDYEEDDFEGKNFYRDRLKPLFFAGLSPANEVDISGINSGGFMAEVYGEVPPLNGGLFERGPDGTDDDGSLVLVPDGAIATVLEDLFERFNFTVTESTPLDLEVAVDPEMLGRVFEELVTGRHETGSYYTPKPVVSFMCREALKGHLGARLPGDSPEEIRRFVEEHDPSGLRDGEGALEALRTVTVCDPACGSGAYLLGMLHELLDLREQLFAVRSLDPISNYDRKLEIIQKNLYGVDIDPFAVNIARLRLWLSLVVEFEGAEKPPPLPNLDFKIEAGDSLLAPDPSGGLELDMVRDEQVSRLDRLKATYLKAHGEEKRRLRSEIDELRDEISVWAHPGGNVSGFDWQVEFAEVFIGDANGTAGGFDVILANPPYLSTKHGFGKENRAWLKKMYRTAKGQYDAYGLFVERALSLMRKEGCYAYIIPKPVLTNANMSPVRQVMQEHLLRAIADPGRVFDASVETVVIVGQKLTANDDAVRIYGESTFSSAVSAPRLKTLRELTTFTGGWNIGTPTAGTSVIPVARSLPTFGNLFDTLRGIECGKRDSSIFKQPSDGTYPLLRGQDVTRYSIAFDHYYIRRNDDERKFKPARLYEPPKLLIRRVTNNLMAAVDVAGFHVLNTIYVAHPKEHCPVSLEYVCALLNSRIVNDYFQEVYVNDDKVFPYVRKNQLESIPLAVPTRIQEQQVVSLVRELSSLIAEGSITDGVIERLSQQLDDLIAAIYADQPTRSQIEAKG